MELKIIKKRKDVPCGLCNGKVQRFQDYQRKRKAKKIESTARLNGEFEIKVEKAKRAKRQGVPKNAEI